MPNWACIFKNRTIYSTANTQNVTNRNTSFHQINTTIHSFWFATFWAYYGVYEYESNLKTTRNYSLFFASPCTLNNRAKALRKCVHCLQRSQYTNAESWAQNASRIAGGFVNVNVKNTEHLTLTEATDDDSCISRYGNITLSCTFDAHCCLNWWMMCHALTLLAYTQFRLCVIIVTIRPPVLLSPQTLQ